MSKQLLLQTIDNYTNTAKTQSVITIPSYLFKENGKLNLQSIKKVIENQTDETDIDARNNPRFNTYNIYLKADNLIFDGTRSNEYLLNTYQIQLPKTTRWELAFHRYLNGIFYWRRNTPITEPQNSGNLFEAEYANSKFDYQYRFKFVSGFYQYTGKTGTFNTILTSNTIYIGWINPVFDDGTPIVLTEVNQTIPTIIEMYDYYSKFEPEDIDNQYNQEISYRKLNNMDTTFTIEYRDLESNQIISDIIEYKTEIAPTDLYELPNTIVVFNDGDLTTIDNQTINLINGLTIRTDAYDGDKYLYFDAVVDNTNTFAKLGVINNTNNIYDNTKSVLFFMRSNYDGQYFIDFFQIQYETKSFFLKNSNRIPEGTDQDEIRVMFENSQVRDNSSDNYIIRQTLSKFIDTSTSPVWNMIYFELFPPFRIILNNLDEGYRTEIGDINDVDSPYNITITTEKITKIVLGGALYADGSVRRNLGGDANADPDLAYAGIKYFSAFDRGLTDEELTAVFNDHKQALIINQGDTYTFPVVETQTHPDMNIMLSTH